MKTPGRTWITKEKTLHDKFIQEHLSGKYAVATLGRWYPEYAIFDIDDRPYEIVEKIRSELGLDETNSMLCGSESKDSYHLIVRPQFNGQPPTLNLLQITLEGYATHKSIEVYPQQNRAIRLPFGKLQACLDAEYAHLTEWSDKMYWFQKLDEFDLSTTPRHQMVLPLDYKPSGSVFLPTWAEGKELLESGLQGPATRHYSQFAVLYYLWRCGVPLDTAISSTWQWIQKRHNDQSSDIVRYPHLVRKEIERQAHHIYTKYDTRCIFPDSTHNSHNGYITQPDMKEIIMHSGGSIPRAKFLFHVIKYSYPRRYRPVVNIHRDKLVQWSSSRTYTKYLNELEDKGIVHRGRGYLAGQFSKPLTLKWDYGNTEGAILYEGRAIDTFEDTLSLIYQPEDFKTIMRTAGAGRTAVIEAAKRIYQE